MKQLRYKLFWLLLFSIAMGFLESAVVVYLRELYYPQGFNFPLVTMGTHIVLVELVREAATIIMLVGIGMLLGESKSARFAYFLFAFAVWDLFYYVFLKLILNWPASLFTWDILFLIPTPWVGPVLAPCLLSLSMLLLALLILYHEAKGRATNWRFSELLWLILGSIILLISFMSDYFNFRAKDALEVYSEQKTPLFLDMAHYIPQNYNWYLFVAAELIMALGLYKWERRMRYV